MAVVVRWVFYDPATGESYTVPINPRQMGSIFPEKSVSIRQTTAVDGKALLFEGSTPPSNWTFEGRILEHDHHAELLRWSQKRNRIQITDHFGRQITCYLLKFESTPRRALGRYWSHDYTMTALILGEPTAPTVEV